MIKKVTLKDIAEDSGLSISTVSRALTRSNKISKENIHRVFESAQRLNYPLPTHQMPLELRKNINIALVTRHYTGEFFASLFEGFDRSTKGLKVRVNLISVSHTSSTPMQVISDLKKSHFDAAVIFLPDYRESDYQAMLKELPAEFPLVSIAPIANPVLDTVTFDNYRGGYLVAQHLEHRGYKDLGIIKGPVSKSEAMLRKNGFIDYIRTSENTELIWEFDGDYSLEMGKEAFEEYKKLNVRPRAIFCSNDSTAIGFMHSALREGYNIPEDVAIVGFDDLPTCDLYTPTITSVHTPYEVLGKKAIELILDRLENSKLVKHSGYTSLVPVTLNVRESSTELDYVFNNPYKLQAE